MGSSAPTLWLIAGPDGVGKTTYAFRYIRAVSGTTEFVNLDEIARGISPLAPLAVPQRAARVALRETRDLIRAKRSFSLETTLAGRTHLRTVAEARAAGFSVTLLFFMVRDVEVSLSRVARRVAEGGHDVPEADVRRRFARAIANLASYLAESDLWRVFDNNGAKPVTVAEGRRGCRALMLDSSGLPAELIERLVALPPCE